MAGKGDTPRPVDPKKWAENYERIFAPTYPRVTGHVPAPTWFRPEEWTEFEEVPGGWVPTHHHREPAR